MIIKNMWRSTSRTAKSKPARRRGFTLIELLVVIAIISLLASVILAALQDARAKAQDAKTIAEVKQLQTALELYIGDHADKPNVSGITASSNGAAWPSSELSKLVTEKYIASLPVTSMGGYIGYTSNTSYFTSTGGSGYICGSSSRDNSSYMILFKTKKPQPTLDQWKMAAGIEIGIACLTD